MQELVYALNDIKRDLNVITQKLAAVDRVIKTGDVQHLMQPIQGQRQSTQQSSSIPNFQFGSQQSFGQTGIPGLWGGGSGGGAAGGRKRNRKRGQRNLFGSSPQVFGSQQGVNPQAYAEQQAQLTAQYLQQMLSQNGQQPPRVG